MNEEKQKEQEQQEETAPTIPYLTLKIGELFFQLPFGYPLELSEKYLNLLIEKAEESLKNKTIKDYLNYIKVKQNTGAYTG